MIRAEQRFAALCEHLPDLVFYDTGGGCEYVSPNVYQMLGYQSSQISGDRSFFPSLIHPDDVGHVGSQVKDWNARGRPEPLVLQFRVRHADQRYRWIEDRMVSVETEHGRHMSGVLVDITPRVHAERALRESESLLSDTIASLAEGVFVHDADGRIVACNSSAAAMIGIEESQILGKKGSQLPLKLVDSAGQPISPMDAPCASTLRTGGTFDNVVMGLVISPTFTRWVSINSRPLSGVDDAKTRGIVSTMADISERKRLHDQLQQNLDTHRLLLRELNHRVANNLAALSGLIDLMRQNATDVASFSATLKDRLQTMSLVHHLLNQSHWRETPLFSLIQALVPASYWKRVHLRGENAPIPATLLTALATVLHELLLNSEKHGALKSANGTLSITASMNSAATRVLSLAWLESGGPTVSGQVVPGGGTQIIEGLLSGELRGRIQWNFAETGASHRVLITLDPDLQPGPKSAKGEPAILTR